MFLNNTVGVNTMTEKIFLENPYLSEIDARITEKKYLKNKFYLKLNRTIFYPNLAGGQPKDEGKINDIDVIDVFEEGGDIVHVIEKNINSDKVHLKIDLNLRFDYMQQHSGQHLLSAVFYKLYNGKTLGFHIGSEYSYIDIDISDFNEEEAKKVETFANKVIYSNLPIKTYEILKDDVSKIPVRQKPTVDSNIRIVEIDGFDFCPCCGTHCKATGEIGMVKIRKWEKQKRNIRIEFSCGFRALNDYSWKNSYINKISNILSTKDKDVLHKFEKLFTEYENLEKDNRDLREELLIYKAKNLLKESQLKNGVRIIKKIFIDTDFKEVSFISSYLKENENVLTLFTVINQEKCQFIFSRNKLIKVNMQRILKAIQNSIPEIKGGGNSQTVQGGSAPEKADEILDMAFDLIMEGI